MAAFPEPNPESSASPVLADETGTPRPHPKSGERRRVRQPLRLEFGGRNSGTDRKVPLPGTHSKDRSPISPIPDSAIPRFSQFGVGLLKLCGQALTYWPVSTVSFRPIALVTATTAWLSSPCSL
jgi:hypothetical protein